MTQFFLFLVIGFSTTPVGVFDTLDACKTFAVSAHIRDGVNWREGVVAAACIEVKLSDEMRARR